MRRDAVGLFWDDTPPPKPPKAEKEKRTPPHPFWLEPDYLPGLEEALAFPVHVMSDAELQTAQSRKEILATDDEVYGNYFLCMFNSLSTNHVCYIEAHGENAVIDTAKMRWIIDNFTTIGFNSYNYDMTMNALALAGKAPWQIKQASDAVIVDGSRSSEVLRRAKVKRIKADHIDIIDVTPLDASLKTYMARLHAKKLQDLPFAPNTILNEHQVAITRWYCVNDTEGTKMVFNHIKEHLDLRVQLSNQFQMDLRSRSDAQLAQEIINHEIKSVTGLTPRRPAVGQSIGLKFHYKPPAYIQFATHEMQSALWDFMNTEIMVGDTGHAECPKLIRERTVVMGGRTYKIGMGGLHSQEKAQTVVAGNSTRILDRDVTGYYPNLILKNGFAPPQLGDAFLTALGRMVDTRTNAKRWVAAADEKGVSKNDIQYLFMVAQRDGMKIANNGVFGKLSDPFSTVYDVPNMVQVTITGQLSLMMAIEWLELSGIPVVSANTDGIVVACPADRYNEVVQIFKAWEAHTGLETEETEYAALYSANVNNYIAVKPDGKTKCKGWYSERGSAHNSVLSKNPEALICSDAVQALLSKGVPVEKTITECKDIRRFVSVRVVNGGGVKVWSDDNVEYLGKTVRWYYAVDVPGELIYAKSGNKVPRTDGAKPLMTLPDTIPSDLDYEWYINQAYRILDDIGASAYSSAYSRATPTDPSPSTEQGANVAHSRTVAESAMNNANMQGV